MPILAHIGGSRGVRPDRGNALSDVHNNRSVNTSLPPLRNCPDPLALLPGCFMFVSLDGRHRVY